MSERTLPQTVEELEATLTAMREVLAECDHIGSGVAILGLSPARVTRAIVAAAVCAVCGGTGRAKVMVYGDGCKTCIGTGLDPTRLTDALRALEGQKGMTSPQVERKERALEDGNVVDAPRPCPHHPTRRRAARIGRRLHYLCCGLPVEP